MTTAATLRKSPFSPLDAPAWWSSDGERLGLLSAEHPNYVPGSLLTIGKESPVARVWIMPLTGEYPFALHWHLFHGGVIGGTRGSFEAKGEWLLDAFNAETLYQSRTGMFTRFGRYLNLPEARKTDNGTDPNVSVYVTDDMIRAVRELVHNST